MNSKQEVKHIIGEVKRGSIAEELGVVSGDELIRINGKKI